MNTSALKLPLADLAPDATDAAWRIAGNQLVKLTRAPLVAALSRNLGPGDEALRTRIAAFLETELGTAMLTAVLSIGLSSLPPVALPGVAAGAVPKLARELRVKAMADAADFAADLLTGPLREALAMLVLTAGAEAQRAASLETPAVRDFASPEVVSTVQG